MDTAPILCGFMTRKEHMQWRSLSMNRNGVHVDVVELGIQQFLNTSQAACPTRSVERRFAPAPFFEVHSCTPLPEQANHAFLGESFAVPFA